MASSSKCPEPQVLLMLMLGQSSDRDSGPLEEHLLHCDRCAQAVTLMNAEDTLVQAVRGADQAVKVNTKDDKVEALIKRLGKMRPHVATSEAGTVEGSISAATADQTSALSAITTPPEISSTPSDGTQVVYEFLATPEQPDELGRLGHYRILKVLGIGGMGIVFQAEDPQLQRLVALKVMLPALASNPSARLRFLREARTAAAIEHDHIVHINQVGEAGGIPFLAMPLLKGESLADRLSHTGELPVAEVLRIAREIAEGLAAAHEGGLIHRDIKPANIWLEGSRGRVKILDFGLARAVADHTQLTQDGSIMGTPAYMAPEQADSSGVDHRCDLFSLGCILYQLSTGQMPFKGGSVMAILGSLLRDNPKPPRELNPKVPAALSLLVMQLLAKKPDDRPATAQEVVEALAAIETISLSPVPVKPSPETREKAPATIEVASSAAAKPSRRSNGRWIAAACLVAGILGGILFLAGGIIYVQTDKGTLKIETKDDSVQVIVEQGGKKITVIDKKTGHEIRLNSGEYTLRLGEDRKDVELSRDHITLKRGQTEVTVITLVTKLEKKRVAEPSHEAWIKSVAALSTEDQVKTVAAKLKERNPGFDGKVTPQFEKGEVIGVDFLTDNITDITPVRALTKLERFGGIGSAAGKGKLADLSPLKDLPLKLLDCRFNAVADLSPLKGMPLEHLFIVDCPNLSDLTPLKGIALISLICGGTRVSDLAPLKDMPLQILHAQASLVADLSPLQGMPLTRLRCDHTNVADLRPLQGINLTHLECHSSKVTDLSPLKGMPLQDIYCDFRPERDTKILRSIKTLEKINDKPVAEFWKEVETQDTDFEWLKQVATLPPAKQVEAVAAKLKERNPGFDGTVTSKIENGEVIQVVFLTDHVMDIAPVRALTKLRHLECGGSAKGEGKLVDLSPLRSLPLALLYCNNTAISDLSPLKGMPLEHLYLVNCPNISDLTPLKGIALISLICGGTQVSELTPLKGMPLQTLSIQGSPVADLSPLQGMPLTRLRFDHTNVADLKPINGMSLTHLEFRSSKVTDLSLLKGMPLKEIGCDFKSERDIKILRSIKTLEKINDKPVAEFWKEVDGKQAVFEGWLNQVAAMPAQKQVEDVAAKLKEHNLGFDGTVTPKIADGVVHHFQFLTDNVTDLAPVRGRRP